MRYDILFSCDYGKLHPAVGEMMDRVNDGMQEFGFAEKAHVRVDFLTGRIDVDKPLTPEQQTLLADECTADVAAKFPDLDVRCKVVPISDECEHPATV